MSNIKSLDKLREVVRCGEAHAFSSSKAYYDALGGCIAEIEREVSERFVELPVDAEGVPIHVGDCLQLGDTHGKVVALTYCPANGKLPWEWQCDTGDWYNTAFAYHYKPRTLEDVLAAFAAELHSDRIDSLDRRIERCAARYADEIREVLGAVE